MRPLPSQLPSQSLGRLAMTETAGNSAGEPRPGGDPEMSLLESWDVETFLEETAGAGTQCQYFQQTGRCPYQEVGCMFQHHQHTSQEQDQEQVEEQGEEQGQEQGQEQVEEQLEEDNVKEENKPRVRERLSARSRNRKMNEERFRRMRDLSISCS